ncbi:MAG: WG repeat-containing protein [Clostridiales bacterium]|nr:WG repeat-containing protein [Clostridiales bacterium]
MKGIVNIGVACVIACALSGCGLERGMVNVIEHVIENGQSSLLEKVDEMVPDVLDIVNPKEEKTIETKSAREFAGYTLEETGSIVDQDGMQVRREVLTLKREDKYYVVSESGTLSASGYDDIIRSLGNGYVLVNQSDPGLDYVGLINAEGEELIPCEAAYIEWLENSVNKEAEKRYLKVVYDTGETTDPSECFFYEGSWLPKIRMNSETYPDCDELEEPDAIVGIPATSTMHTGYARIYDVENKRFVDVGEITNPEEKACGSGFTVVDAEGITKLYDDDGNVRLELKETPYIGDGYLMIWNENSYKVYDDEGTFLFRSIADLSLMESTSGLIKTYQDRKYGLVDRKGDQVLPASYRYIEEEQYGVVSIWTEDDGYALIDLKGNVLASSDNSFYSLGKGYYYTKSGESYMLAGPDGIVAENLDNLPSKACVTDGSKALVLKDKAFSLQLEGELTVSLGTGLIAAMSDVSGKWGVYDLYTGKQLLDYLYAKIESDYSYANIESEAGYLYARQGENWFIYKITEKENEMASEVADEVNHKDEEIIETETVSDSEGSEIASWREKETFGGYTLQETGSIADQDGMQVRRGVLTLKYEDKYYVVSESGSLSVCGYDDIVRSLGNGYILVNQSDPGLDFVGLINDEGEELIPCEAAYIEWLGNSVNQENEKRYLKVVYDTGETPAPSECFFYKGKRMQRMDWLMDPESFPDCYDLEETNAFFDIPITSTMHTGYARIYDVENKQFVDVDEITNHEGKTCGSGFTLVDADGFTNLYDADGNVKFKKKSYVRVGDGYLIAQDENAYEVYDDKGTLLFSSAALLSLMESTSGLIEIHKDGKDGLVDRKGNQVLPIVYQSISSEEYGIVNIRSEDDAYALIDLDGNILASSDGGFSSIGKGYYYTKTGESYMLAGPNGIVVENLDNKPTDACVTDGSKALVLKDKTFSLQLQGEQTVSLGTGLIAVMSDTSGKWGVYDLYTGTQLLDYSYTKIEAGDGYLYARQGERWIIYKVNSI